MPTGVSDTPSDRVATVYATPVTSELPPSEISDRLRIHDLLIVYANAVDGRDWDTLRTVFTEDAVLDYTVFGGPRGTVDEAVEWLATSLARVPMTQHLITNVLVHLDTDTADVTSAVFNPLGTDSEVVLIGGTYRDRVERTGRGWLIAERTASFTWSNRPIKRPN
jgi:3-phenylpropionate/cinnamic acid dioxygenase small subunit